MSDRGDGDEERPQSPLYNTLPQLSNPDELLLLLDEHVGLWPDTQTYRSILKPPGFSDEPGPGFSDEPSPSNTRELEMSYHGDEEPPQPDSLLNEESFPGFSDEPGPSNRRLEGQLWPDMRRSDSSTLLRPPRGELSEAQAEHLVSRMKSRSFRLELDLSRNSIKGPVAELLLTGLDSLNYRQITLRLSDCILSERCLDSLISALTRSWLMELDLSGNKHLMDSGVKLLSVGLKSRPCNLRILRLVCCGLTESSCASLSSALDSSPCLKVLDLSGNSVKDSGVELLCAGLRSPLCLLETLSLSCCDLSENSCGYLASALKYHLKKLDLSLNQLQDAGIKLLTDGLKSHNCPLKLLRLISCGVSDEGCATLVSALKSWTSGLTELDLSGNQLQRRGMELLSGLAESPLCNLITLRVDYGRNLIRLKRHFQHFNLESGSFKPWRSEVSTALMSEDTVKPLVVYPGLFLDPINIPVVDKGGSQTGRFFTPATSRGGDLPHYGSRQRPQWKRELPRRTLVAPSAGFNLTVDPHAANVKTKDLKATVHFTPDVLMNKPAAGPSYRFRAPCPGVYQCSLTKLLFTMSGEGELLYRMVQWDENMLLAAGKTPAGPLYDIQCLEGSVSQLHLPHCGPGPGLTVVHITDDGMSVLKPLDITETHVVVGVPHLSAFGLVLEIIKRFLNIPYPIKGQILLFHRAAFARNSRKVNVFLLPENVPLPEVKNQQENADFIEATCSCVFIKGHSYSLHCAEAYRVQPPFVTFDFTYGPNYHPTFEIRLTSSTEEATVTVRDKDDHPVWEYLIELSGLRSASSSFPAPEPVSLPVQTEGGASASASSCGSRLLSDEPPADEAASLTEPAEQAGPDPSSQNLPNTPGEDEQQLFRVRTEFIDRLSNPVLKDLLDKLLQTRVINSGELESVQTMSRPDKARQLVDMVLRKGNSACKVLIRTLCDLDPFVSETLQLS